MASSANLSARITIDNQASAVLAQVRGEIEKTNAAAAKGAASGGSFGAAWGKAALLLGGAGLGVAALTRQLGEAAKAAAADEQSMVRLNRTLANMGIGGAAADMRAWVDSTQAALGVSDSLLRDALIPLTTATKDAAKAQDLMSLALDINAAGFADTQKAAKALALAYTGNVTALSRLRIPMDQAILKSGDFVKITEELARVVGGSAADAAETAAGKYARWNESIGELQESVGYGLITVLESLDRAVGGSGGAAGAMNTWGRELENAGRGVAYLVDGVSALVVTLPGLNSVDDAMSSTILSTQVFGNTFSNLANVIDGVRAVLDSTSDSYYRMTTLLTDAEIAYTDSEGAIHSWVDGVETITPAAKAAADGSGELAEGVEQAGKSAYVATERISALAGAMGLLDTTANRQQALQSFKDALAEFVAKPSKETAYAVIDDFNTAYDSFKEGGKRQAQFVVDNYDEMVETIKNSGLSEQAQAELIKPLKDARTEAQKTLDTLKLIAAGKWSTDIVINRILSGNLPVFGDGAATGGYITGPGTGTSDSIPARLSNGEYVIRAAAVKTVGRSFLDAVNAQGYARGGPVRSTFINNHGIGAAGVGGVYDFIRQLIPTTDTAREETRRYEELLREQERAAKEREREREEAERERLRLLEELHRQQQAIISAARATLEAAQATRNDFASSVASGAIGFGSVTGFRAEGSDWAALSRRRPGSEGAGGPASSGGSASAYMAGRLARVQRFGDVVRQLAAAGLNTMTLREVISAGPDEGTTLGEALLEAGEVGNVNTIQRSLNEAASSIGAFAGNTVYADMVAGQNAAYQGVVMANGGRDDSPIQVNLVLDSQIVATQLLQLNRYKGLG